MTGFWIDCEWCDIVEFRCDGYYVRDYTLLHKLKQKIYQHIIKRALTLVKHHLTGEKNKKCLLGGH